MRVLLIGGTGFIGRRVVDHLQRRGHSVAIFHRGQTSSLTMIDAPRIHGNRLEIDQHISRIMEFKPDAVVDLLPWNDMDTQRVIDTFKGRVERVVHLSSGDVYKAWGNLLKGAYGEPVPLSETASLREDLYPYAGKHAGMEHYDKMLAERVILHAHYHEGYPGVIVRLPMVYGPDDRQHRTYEYVRRMKDERPAILMGCCHAAWLWQRGYVDDVAFAITLAVERPSATGQIYNVGDRITLSMAGWVRAIGNVLGWDGEIVLVPDERLPSHLQNPYIFQQHFLFDTTKIRRELGYQELVDPDDALCLTVEWQSGNPPSDADRRPLDYAAEDAALKEAAGV